MCMVNPHEIYKIETTYRTQANDICGSYSPAPSDSASSIWLIRVYIYTYKYFHFCGIIIILL